MSTNDVPQMFRGLCIRDIDWTETKTAHAVFTEATVLSQLAALVSVEFERLGRAVVIADICSCSAGATLAVLRDVTPQLVYLVDLDAEALSVGRSLVAQFGVSVEALQIDACRLKESHVRADIMLLNSAYHHIRDGEKRAFLSNVAACLSPDGVVLVGDHFLSDYDSEEGFRSAVVEFYKPLIRDLVREGGRADAVRVIRQSAFNCWSRHVEFKVSWSKFTDDVASADMNIVRRICVWSPHAEKTTSAGTYVCALRRAN